MQIYKSKSPAGRMLGPLVTDLGYEWTITPPSSPPHSWRCPWYTFHFTPDNAEASITAASDHPQLQYQSTIPAHPSAPDATAQSRFLGMSSFPSAPTRRPHVHPSHPISHNPRRELLFWSRLHSTAGQGTQHSVSCLLFGQFWPLSLRCAVSGSAQFLHGSYMWSIIFRPFALV